MHDVCQKEYTTVIRGMIKSENDVTNYRIMWLLVGQGFIANAYVAVEKTGDERFFVVLPLAGILFALSAFFMIYKSYLARGYLEFLGEQAKLGKLEEEYLPLVGWPRKRIKNWWKGHWSRSWIGGVRDVIEPLIFLPSLFMFMWVSAFLLRGTRLDPLVVLPFAIISTAVILFLSGGVFLWSQSKYEKQAR